MPTRNILKYLAPCSAAALIIACANQMEPAKNAQAAAAALKLTTAQVAA
jgi:hypothetical protein